MLIAIVITVIFALALFYAMKAWYQNLENKYQSISSQISKIIPSGDSSVFSDWTGSLSHASQVYAMKSFCNLKGYDYFPPANTSTGEYGGCLYNETTCKADSNPHWVSCQLKGTRSASGTGYTAGDACTGGPYCTGGYFDHDGNSCNINQNPYLEWHTDANGVGRCLVSTFPPSFIKGVCESQGLGGWYPGTPNCDSSGYCDINPNDIPTCILTSDYCDSMGLDYEHDTTNGVDLGDCNLSDWQNIAEAIFGKTITRTFKRNAEAMIHECHDNPISANCALSIGTFLITDDQIIMATADKEFQGYMDNLKTACSGNIYSSFDSFANCGASLFPGFYLSKQVVGFADGMLDGMIGWIPGVPHGLIGKALGYVGKYGALAAQALFHAGEAAVHAFDVAGDYCQAALNNIGLGAEGRVVFGAISNIVNFGVGMAKVIAGVAKEAIEIFAQDIVPAAYHVFHAITDAVLHPKEFFNHVLNDLTNFISDPIGSIKGAFTTIANVGGKILDAAKMVANYLKNVAGKVLGQLGQDLADLAQHLEDAFKDIGNDIADGAKAAWDGFKSIF